MPRPSPEEKERLESSIQELSVLNDIATHIHVSDTVESITRTIIDRCVSYLGASQGAVFLLEDPAEGWEFTTFVREGHSQERGDRFHLDESLKGWMIANRSSIVTNDPQRDDRLRGVQWERSGITSLAAAPLISRGKLLGLVAVFNGSGETPFTEDDGRFLGIVGLQAAYVLEGARHLEIERRFVDELRAQKAATLARFIAGVVHELNTPLGVLASSLDTSQRVVEGLAGMGPEDAPKGGGPGSAYQAALRKLAGARELSRSSLSRIAETVSRLKSFVQLDASDLQSLDLAAALDECLEMLRYESGSRIRIRRQYEAAVAIYCYPADLKQAFFNVLLNAVQAIPGEGEIAVSTRTEGEQATIRVTDTGRGMAPDKLQGIFDPGFSVQRGRVAASLGLPLCYQIIQRHQGHVHIESQEGRGTIVTMTLPLNLEDRLSGKPAST